MNNLIMPAMCVTTLSLAGCATIGEKPPRYEDTARELRSAPKPELKPFPTVAQTGSSVEVHVAESCMTRHWRDYDRVTVFERRNESKGLTWFKAIAGMGLIAGGVPVLIDANNVGSSAGNTAVYNPVGKDAAYGIGAALAGFGALSLGSAIYDVVVANGAGRTLSRVEKDETFTGPFACDSAAAHGLVRLILESDTPPRAAVLAPVDLGALDPSGNGRFDLATAIPSGKLAAEAGAGAAHLVFVSDGSSGIPAGSYQIGDVDLRAARASHAARVWASLDKEKCRHAHASHACDGVVAFAKSYPDSPEKAQADSLLVEAKPALESAADNEAWAAISTSDCAKPKTESACVTVVEYVLQHPNGLHAAEANRLLKNAKLWISLLRGAREAREAAEARARAAAEAAATRRANSPCGRVLGYQRGEAYSCSSIISMCRSTAQGDRGIAQGCISDLVGLACDSCL